jgi:hypothetical protein
MLVKLLIYPSNFGNPLLAIAMFELHDLLRRPVKVIGNIRYLLF